MALITDPGSHHAESYVSVGDADQYHELRASAGWSGEHKAKEAALRRATLWLDGGYRDRFPGTRTNGRYQALEWPRRNALDASGSSIAENELPIEIIHAVCEVALRELAAPGSLSPDIVPAQRIESEKVGSISITYASESGLASQRPVLTVVEDILNPLLSRPGNARFLLRA